MKKFRKQQLELQEEYDQFEKCMPEAEKIVQKWVMGKESLTEVLQSSVEWPFTNGINSDAELRKAYRSGILNLHPDRVKNKCQATLEFVVASKVFAALKEAHDIYHENDCGNDEPSS